MQSVILPPSARPKVTYGLATRSYGPRRPDAPVSPLFLERWSPRAFDGSPVTRSELQTLFEAARWAPSSNNTQPWRFLYAVEPGDRERFLAGLSPANQLWARGAGALAYLLVRRDRSAGPNPSPISRFDAGAAWMSLALQAELLGLSAHAVGGLDRERVHGLLGVSPEEFEVLIAIAVGRRGHAKDLPALLAERERPSPRRPLREIVQEGPMLPAPKLRLEPQSYS
jgi:nitroreductase